MVRIRDGITGIPQLWNPVRMDSDVADYCKDLKEMQKWRHFTVNLLMCLQWRKRICQQLFLNPNSHLYWHDGKNFLAGLGMGTNLCGDRCVWVWFCVPCSLHVRNKPYCEVNPGVVVCRVECRTIQTCHDPARRLGQVNGRVGDKNSVTFCIEPSTRFGLWIFVGSVLMLRSLQCIGTVGWVTGRASGL